MSLQAQLSEARPETIQKLRDDPRKYVMNAWPHPNDPSRRYDFRTTNGNRQLDYLLDPKGPLNPEQWGGINILLFARGLLKTTTTQMILNWAHQFYGPKGLDSYMAAPRESQTREFGRKFQEKLDWSGLSASQEKRAIHEKTFKFDVNGNTRSSAYQADSGWGEGDAMRGPHSHIGVYDEFQDASRRSFNAGFYEVIDQRIAGVDYFPTIFILGTPKMEGSFYEEMWQRSDMREWDADANTWLRTDDAERYGEGGDAVEVRGWHIDQVKAPLHTDAEIAAKRDMKSEQEFANEVLAQFYSPEDHLLSERHIHDIADPEMNFVASPRSDDNWISIGVDWGGGSDRKAADTVVVVMEHIEYEDAVESVINSVDFLDESLTKREEFERLETTMLQFDPDVVVVDDGYGSTRRENLQEGNYTVRADGYSNVVGCRFGNISNPGQIKWKTNDENLFTADKSHMAKSFVDFVKSQRLVLPAATIETGGYGEGDMGSKIFQQLTAPYEEKTETKSGKKKTTVTSKDGMNDDMFDASVYAWMGYHVDDIGPSTAPAVFSTSSMPGYQA